MKQAFAIRTFTRADNGERVKRGATISGEDSYIDDLERVGNVSFTLKANSGAPENRMAGQARMTKEEETNPTETAGAARTLSASPAVPASTRVTLTSSKPGAPAAKTAAAKTTARR